MNDLLYFVGGFGVGVLATIALFGSRLAVVETEIKMISKKLDV